MPGSSEQDILNQYSVNLAKVTSALEYTQKGLEAQDDRIEKNSDQIRLNSDRLLRLELKMEALEAISRKGKGKIPVSEPFPENGGVRWKAILAIVGGILTLLTTIATLYFSSNTVKSQIDTDKDKIQTTQAPIESNP